MHMHYMHYITPYSLRYENERAHGWEKHSEGNAHSSHFSVVKAHKAENMILFLKPNLNFLG